MTRKNTVFLCRDARVHSSKKPDVYPRRAINWISVSITILASRDHKTNKIIKVKGLLWHTLRCAGKCHPGILPGLCVLFGPAALRVCAVQLPPDSWSRKGYIYILMIGRHSYKTEPSQKVVVSIQRSRSRIVRLILARPDYNWEMIIISLAVPYWANLPLFWWFSCFY